MHPDSVYMISSALAKQLIIDYSAVLPAKIVALDRATGLILAKDIYASADVPTYPQSAMDGYAFDFASIGQPILLTGDQAAGNNPHLKIKAGSAVRIFTGAVVPEGANTVVIQEKSKVVDGLLVIEDENLKHGANVRPPGTEIKNGALALPAGSLLTPPAIGFLAGIGVSSVEVIPSPKVSIIVTGNELQKPGTTPEYGKVYESNSFALAAAFDQLYIHNVTLFTSEDNPEQLNEILKRAIAHSDIVLMTGGVSVGDYDFTVRVAENCGVEKVFHKIKQKPGKPFFFGKKDKLLFFGLPGNPASSLTCFYEYIIPALQVLTGKNMSLETHQVPISSSYKKTAGFTHFLKGIFDGHQVHLPEGQESYKLNSFARANCLIVLSESQTEVTPGETVEIHLLPK